MTQGELDSQQWQRVMDLRDELKELRALYDGQRSRVVALEAAVRWIRDEAHAGLNMASKPGVLTAIRDYCDATVMDHGPGCALCLVNPRHMSEAQP